MAVFQRRSHPAQALRDGVEPDRGDARLSRLPFDPPLYVITDRSRFPSPSRGEPFSAEEWRALEAVIAAGPGAIQLRDKDLDGGPLFRRAERLAIACRAAGVRFLVNDRIDVAIASGADGAHLPGAGIAPADARSLVGEGFVLGRSIHSESELASSRGADFLLFGPVYDTPSKRKFGEPQGVARLAALCAATPLPVLAIGGVTAERVRDVRAAGAAGVAVVGAVLGAADPRDGVLRLRDALA